MFAALRKAWQDPYGVFVGRAPLAEVPVVGRRYNDSLAEVVSIVERANAPRYAARTAR